MHIGTANGMAATTSTRRNAQNKVLREAMEELTSGRKRYFATIQHVNGNHWVPVVLDFETRSLHYGDSLRMTPDADLMAILDWWSVAHTGQQFKSCKALDNSPNRQFLPAAYSASMPLAISWMKNSFRCSK